MKKHSIYFSIVFFLFCYSTSIAQKHVRVKVHIVKDCITEQNAIDEIHKLNTNYYSGSGIIFMLDYDNINAIDENAYDNVEISDFSCSHMSSPIFQNNDNSSLNIYYVPDIETPSSLQGTIHGFAELVIGNACVVDKDKIGGSTTAHEVGHCLGLYHPDQVECNGVEGDLVNDTDPYDNPGNIMNQTGGSLTHFTSGQKSRMGNMLNSNLAYIVFNPIKEVLVKNSFGAGEMIIDDASPINISSSGKLNDNWHHSSFPHSFKAVDPQQPSGNLYVQRYQDWNTPNGVKTPKKTQVPSPESFLTVNYEANFLPQFSVTFQNSFGGGVIEVNDNEEGSQTSIFPVVDGDEIQGKALYQVIDGIEHVFDYWSHSGGTNSTKTFTVTGGHKNYIAYFDPGIPVNSYRNLQFNYGDPVGTPIELTWSQHPDDEVTKYKIYRKTKYGSPTLISTVNRTGSQSHTYTYTDGLYSITNNTSSNNLLKYDVRAYYEHSPNPAIESEDDWQSIYGEMMWKKAEEENDNTFAEVLEYGMSNYPNPFNPTTTIHYQLPEDANVSIKVFDILGKQVVELVNGEKGIGKHNVMFNSSNLSAGLYIYTIEAKPTNLNGKGFSKTNKMLLVK